MGPLRSPVRCDGSAGPRRHGRLVYVAVIGWRRVNSRLPLLPGASLLANGQLNGSASKNGHKDDGSLRSQGLDGGEDGPVKKR